MGIGKQNSIFDFLQSYFVGSLLCVSIVSIVAVWSLILIVGPTQRMQAQQAKKTKLAVQAYSPAQAKTPEIIQKTTSQVLSASTEQPAQETWQGPIDPIPDNPAQPTIPIISTVPTAEPIVFLTIDDGWVQTPEESVWLTQHHLPFTLFLTDNGIKNNYQFFQLLQSAGMSIEDHTISHPALTRLSAEQQRAEICGAADKYSDVFGIRPTMLRPPYGKANQDTKNAAAACGMKEIIMWRAFVEKGVMHYQDNLTHLNPGDIVLMHFTNNFLQDIEVFMNQANADHLQVANLEDWLP